MKKVSLQGRASQWVIIFEDFSSSYGGHRDLEPEPPFLGRVVQGADTGRVTVRYQLVNGIEVERRVNRACCSTKVFPSRSACEDAALRAADLLKLSDEQL